MKMNIIIPTEGLCNRFRVMFSYLTKLSEIQVLWNKDKTVSFTHFLDIFEPIPKINFIYTKPTEILYSGYGTCLSFDKFYYNYILLKPKIEIINKIRDIIKNLGENYNACHIRRTDHIKIAKSHHKFTNDFKFIDFIKKSDKTVYVATDNKFTQDSLKKIFGNKVRFGYNISPTKNLRQTSLEEALIDLIICSGSVEFLGSGYSSFSHTIQIFKQIDFIKKNINENSEINDIDIQEELIQEVQPELLN